MKKKISKNLKRVLVVAGSDCSEGPSRPSQTQQTGFQLEPRQGAGPLSMHVPPGGPVT